MLEGDFMAACNLLMTERARKKGKQQREKREFCWLPVPAGRPAAGLLKQGSKQACRLSESERRVWSARLASILEELASLQLTLELI